MPFPDCNAATGATDPNGRAIAISARLWTSNWVSSFEALPKASGSLSILVLTLLASAWVVVASLPVVSNAQS
jgi:hypothetical protein